MSGWYNGLKGSKKVYCSSKQIVPRRGQLNPTKFALRKSPRAGCAILQMIDTLTKMSYMSTASEISSEQDVAILRMIKLNHKNLRLLRDTSVAAVFALFEHTMITVFPPIYCGQACDYTPMPPCPHAAQTDSSQHWFHPHNAPKRLRV